MTCCLIVLLATVLFSFPTNSKAFDWGDGDVQPDVIFDDDAYYVLSINPDTGQPYGYYSKYSYDGTLLEEIAMAVPMNISSRYVFQFYNMFDGTTTAEYHTSSTSYNNGASIYFLPWDGSFVDFRSSSNSYEYVDSSRYVYSDDLKGTDASIGSLIFSSPIAFGCYKNNLYATLDYSLATDSVSSFYTYSSYYVSSNFVLFPAAVNNPSSSSPYNLPAPYNQASFERSGCVLPDWLSYSYDNLVETWSSTYSDFFSSSYKFSSSSSGSLAPSLPISCFPWSVDDVLSGDIDIRSVSYSTSADFSTTISSHFDWTYSADEYIYVRVSYWDKGDTGSFFWVATETFEHLAGSSLVSDVLPVFLAIVLFGGCICFLKGVFNV